MAQIVILAASSRNLWGSMSTHLSEKVAQDTPMWRQWHSCKQAAPDCLLLFRLGDFYEAFHEDASTLADVLEIVLTHRQGIAMAGVPCSQLESILDRLVAAGHKVAVADQLGEAQGKGILERGIVRIVSPGTLMQSNLLHERSSNHLVAMSAAGNLCSLTVVELSCGKVTCFELDPTDLKDELERLDPREILVAQRWLSKNPLWKDFFQQQPNLTVSVLGDEYFDASEGLAVVQRCYGIPDWQPLGIQDLLLTQSALVAALKYVESMFVGAWRSLEIPYLRERTARLRLDNQTVRHLDLMNQVHTKAGKDLLSLLDQTGTAMGGRLLRQWLRNPSACADVVQARWQAVSDMLSSPLLMKSVAQTLANIRDIERMSTRLASGLGSPRDLHLIRESLRQIPGCISLVCELKARRWQEIAQKLVRDEDLFALLERACPDEPSSKCGEGGCWRLGWNSEYDRLTQLVRDRTLWLDRYLEEQREATGCRNLRYGQHQSFGYYLELPKQQATKAPSSWTRRQTLTNVERFTTHELRQFEKEALVAQDELRRLELMLFESLRESIKAALPTLRRQSAALAEMDVYCCFSCLASRNGWVKPELVLDDILDIQMGRHPIVEEVLPMGSYIASDCSLTASKRLMVLTGPNMGGKSTYMRMAGVLVIMAQMGSFVPAKRMRFGLVDQVFTRIGASDDLASGHSTFMVEMLETAAILHQATARSLVLLDEIGRGTGTSDGLAIAWAVAEELLEGHNKSCKTLFATHYLELCQLSARHSKAFNAHVAVSECDGMVTFLHRVQPGSADRSYGLHVAKLAGIPHRVVQRAMELQQLLDRQMQRRLNTETKHQRAAVESLELSLFEDQGVTI